MGAEVHRVSFNRGDEAEWGETGPLHRFKGSLTSYRDALDRLLEAHQVTDLVLYGESRPMHAHAVQAARSRGLVCHLFEEGYLRPSWITYERFGTNGHSRLREISLSQMVESIRSNQPNAEAQEDGWGDYHAHIWQSARYYAHLLLPSRQYNRAPRRGDLSLWHELTNYIFRFSAAPWRCFVHERRAKRIAAREGTYHLVLLQLPFDCSMQCHSPFSSSAEFVTECLSAFASGGTKQDCLVFKSHPLDDGREKLGQLIPREARDMGIGDRVHFVDCGSQLSTLVANARSAVTVNSTAVHHAFSLGLPVAALGNAVYDRPELVSDQALDRFFTAPRPPNPGAYTIFRRFMLATSQIRGSFYSQNGIDRLLLKLPPLLLTRDDPYDRALGFGGGQLTAPLTPIGGVVDDSLKTESRPSVVSEDAVRQVASQKF
jgi:capsular polysaccharide export protein